MSTYAIANLGPVGEWMDAAIALPPPSEEDNFQASYEVLVWVRWSDGNEGFTDARYSFDEECWELGSAECYTVLAWALIAPPDEMRRRANHSTDAIEHIIQLDKHLDPKKPQDVTFRTLIHACAMAWQTGLVHAVWEAVRPFDEQAAIALTRAHLKMGTYGEFEGQADG